MKAPDDFSLVLSLRILRRPVDAILYIFLLVSVWRKPIFFAVFHYQRSFTKPLDSFLAVFAFLSLLKIYLCYARFLSLLILHLRHLGRISLLLV